MMEHLKAREDAMQAAREEKCRLLLETNAKLEALRASPTLLPHAPREHAPGFQGLAQLRRRAQAPFFSCKSPALDQIV